MKITLEITSTQLDALHAFLRSKMNMSNTASGKTVHHSKIISLGSTPMNVGYAPRYTVEILVIEEVPTDAYAFLTTHRNIVNAILDALGIFPED